MRILLVGGIFGSSRAFREVNLQQTTETLLAENLESHGFTVTTASHRSAFDIYDHDLVHIHHLATGCVRTLAQLIRRPWRARPRIVFTRHATKKLPLRHSAILYAMQRCADALVALSPQERDLIVAQSGRSSSVHVIPNGIDSSHFEMATRRPPEDGKPWRLLYVGQLIELKRVEIAIRVVHSLRSRGCDAELHIVSHRDTLRPELESLAELLGIADHVTFHPPATRAQVGDHMRSAHLLLLPSRTEALPTVVLEAGLTGLPTLAFDVGGVRTLLPTRAECLPPADIAGYIEQAHQYVTQYEDLLAMYSAHREWLVGEYSITKMVCRHAELYRALRTHGGKA